MPTRRALLSTAATGVLVAATGCLSSDSEGREAVSAYRRGHEHYRDADEAVSDGSGLGGSTDRAQFREAATRFQRAREQFTEARSLAREEKPKRIARTAAKKSAIKSVEMDHRAEGAETEAEGRRMWAQNYRVAPVADFTRALGGSYGPF